MIDESPEGHLLDGVLANINAYYSRDLSRKTKRGMYKKFDEGLWPGWAPLGYLNTRNSRGEGVVVIDKDQGPLIARAFELYSTGEYSMLRLCRETYGLGLRSRTGKKIHSSTLQQILSNPFYYGLMRFNGLEKRGRHKRLIDKKLFDLCQYVAAKNRGFQIRERKHDFLLRSFVTCKRHDRRLVAEWHPIKSKKRGNMIAYYHCASPGGCPDSYIEAGKLEKAVSDRFKQLEFKEEFVELVKKKVRGIYEITREKASAEQKAIQNQIIGFEKKRNKLEEMLLDDTIDRATFKRLHEDLQTQISVLQGKIIDLDQKRQLDINLIDEVLALTRNISGAYEEAPKELKRHYLRFFFERLIVDKKKLVGVKYTPAFRVLKREEKLILNYELLPG